MVTSQQPHETKPLSDIQKGDEYPPQRKVQEICHLRSQVYPTEPVTVCSYVRVSTRHKEQLSSLENQTQHYQQRFSYVYHCF